MTAARTAASLVLAVALSFALSLSGAAPASADPWDPGGGDDAPVVTGTQRRQLGGCRIYGGQGGFGMRCGALTGGGLSARAILGGDPLPDCWQEDLPGDLVDQYAPQEQQRLAAGDRGRFVLETCLVGVDERTYTATPDFGFTEKVEWLPAGQPPEQLTANQRRLLAIWGDSRTIPLPSVVTSPTIRPRVGQDVAFSVRNGDEVGPIGFDRPGPGGVVRMQATLVYLRVVPEPGAAPVRCDGPGIQVTATDTRQSRPEACWATYDRSSAAQPQQRYAVRAVALWLIQYQTGGVWNDLTVVEKEQTALVPVSEVQTVVVP